MYHVVSPLDAAFGLAVLERLGPEDSRSALRYWAGWHAARYGIELPVPEAAVLQFVVDHVVRRNANGELAEFEAMLATCDDSLEGRRDRTLLCFRFASGGRRHSEIATAELRDWCRIGAQGYLYRLEHSKTQQAGVTANSTPDKPVLDRAALALQDL